MSAIAKSSRVKGRLSGRLYFGVAGSLEGIDETVALLKFLFILIVSYFFRTELYKGPDKSTSLTPLPNVELELWLEFKLPYYITSVA